MIAALYVMPNGPYAGLTDVDVWDEARDARTYAGPWAVVAHPPCARWSMLANVNRARYGIPVGSDDGCFASALASVRTYGGVLEHPAQSMAWTKFGLHPPPSRGWGRSLLRPTEWTTEVCQRNYGHRARKRTWLLYVGAHPPAMDWTPPPPPLAQISTCKPTSEMTIEHMGRAESLRTPVAFRDALLSMARG